MTDDSLPTPTEDLPGVAPEAEAPGRRKRALWGVLAVLAVGVGALAVRAADDPPNTVPVAFGAAGSESAAADMSMRAFVRYVAGPELPALGGEGPAYRVPADTTTSRVVELARALDLAGEPTQGDGTWHLQDGDRTLDVYEGLGSQWSYGAGNPDAGYSVAVDSGSASSSPVCVGGPAVDCAPVEEPTTTTVPADPGAADDAKALALDLLAATGMDLTDVEVTVEGPQPGYWIYVIPRVDGHLAADLGASVGIGPDGAVQFANGRLGRPESVGDVAMVDTTEAIERLNEGMGGWSAYGAAEIDASATGSGYAECEASADGRETCSSVPPCATEGMAQEAPTTTAAMVDPDTPLASDDSTTASDGVDAIEPVEPSITPPADCGYSPPSVPEEPVEVVLNEARVNLMLLPASDGSNDGYLVPGYEFDSDDGGTVAQVAIADDALEPVDVDPEPTPAPYPGTPGCVQPEPGPDGAVPDICLDPGTATTVPFDSTGGGSSGSSGNSSSSPGVAPDDPTMSIQPDPLPGQVTPTTPCVLPKPGPNGEVPAIACADGPPPSG
jgi:hypothetical protein